MSKAMNVHPQIGSLDDTVDDEADSDDDDFNADLDERELVEAAE